MIAADCARSPLASYEWLRSLVGAITQLRKA